MKMRMSQNFGTASLGALALSLCMVTPAVAQSTGAAQASNDDTQLDTITVTARRRAENMQNTPVAVSAIGAGALADINLNAVSKVEQLVPNLTMKESSGDIAGNYTYIRGIGTGEPLLTVDSPVGVYMDGVIMGRQSGNNFDLVTPERIEVLRGPQGTLFGRNTTGGAVNIISHTPTNDFRASLEGSYGSFNSRSVVANVDIGTLGNTGLTAYVAGSYRARDGFFDNTNTPDNKDPGARKSRALFGKLHGEWGALTMDIAADWNKVSGQRNPWQTRVGYPDPATYFGRSPSFGGDAFIVQPTGRQKAGPMERIRDQESEAWGFSNIFSYEVSDALNFKSIMAWRGWSSDNPTNYAGELRGRVLDFASPTLFSVQRVAPFVAFVQKRHQAQFSEEFQIYGKTDNLSYIFGAYYFNERAREFNTNAFTLALSPYALPFLGFPTAVRDALVGQNIDLIGFNLGQTLAYSTRNRSTAGFGQVSWTPMGPEEGFELTAGIRYTKDKRELDQTSVTVAKPFTGTLINQGPTPGPSRQGDLSYTNWSYLASASYKFSPDFMTYARFSTGYKAGGFDARTNTANFVYKPEKAKSYELGFKSEFANRRVRLNGAVFHVDYNGLQVAQYAGGNGFVPNADARYRGFELELQAVAAPGLTFDGSVGMVDRKYKRFIINLNGPDYASVAKFAYAPKWTIHVGGEYKADVGIGEARFRADYTRTTKRYFTTIAAVNPSTEDIIDPGQDLLSARISLGKIPVGAGDLTLTVFGENLLNETQYLAGIDFGPSIGIAGVNVGPPRSYGVSAKISF